MSDSDSVKPIVFIVSLNQVHYLLCISNSSISKQEYLSWITINRLFFQQSLQRSINFCSTYISVHALDLFSCFFDMLIMVLHAISKDGKVPISEAINVEICLLREAFDEED